MAHFPDMIVPGVYLGNMEALSALVSSEREEQEDWCVVSVLEASNVIRSQHLFQHMVIELEDDPESNILSHFHSAHDFIMNSLLQNKSVLIHCMEGISRSATITVAYLMISRSMSYVEAMNFVSSKRNVIGPNYGFREQLKKLEQSLTNPIE